MNRDSHIIHSLFIHFVLLVGLFLLLLIMLVIIKINGRVI